MIRRLLISACTLGLLVAACPRIAESAEGGSAVSGKVELPPPASRKSAAKRGTGFVERAKNPLRPPDGMDPRGQMVIVLEGGPIDENDRKVRASRYDIVGENFESDILPVIVGGKVEIKNKGRKSPRLYSKTQADVVPSDPISKKGVRVTQAITEANKAIDIRDLDSVHFLGHIVAFESPYFAVLKYDGKFDFEGIPAGTWTVKIWYRDGWVKNLPKTTLSVGGKRPPKPIKVTLPATLDTGSAAK